MRFAVVISPAHRRESAGRLWEQLVPWLGSDDRVQIWAPGLTEEETAALALPAPLPAVCTGGPAADAIAWLEGRFRAWMPELVLFYGDFFGHESAARLAARLGCGLMTDVGAARREERGFSFLRGVCSSHLSWRVRAEGTFVVSVLRGMPRVTLDAAPFEVRMLPPEGRAPGFLLERRQLECLPVNPLEQARRLLVGGRGLGSAENCEKMRNIAASMGAVPGFTRAVALSGWCGMDEIVGQSGARTSPEVCLTLGVSGAAAFLAGVSDAGRLIAVNTDADAPIFAHADIGIVEDAVAFMEAFGRTGGDNIGIS